VKALDLVVVTRVVAERAFDGGLVAGRIARIGLDEAFEHDLRAAATQEAGELILGQRVGHRGDRAEDGGGIRAQCHRDRKRNARMRLRVIAEVQRAAAMREPAQDHAVTPDHLLAIDAQVLALLVRAARHGQAPGNSGAESPGQRVWVGSRPRSISPPSQITSWHGAEVRTFGAMSSTFMNTGRVCCHASFKLYGGSGSLR